MHQNNTVVTLYALKGHQKTPLREYDHSRQGLSSSSRVTLPFGTEYGIGFKFQDYGRRRLELWIDGTLVSDQIILDGDVVLERFLDSDRRFRFVEASHQDVADPSNPDNGGILIKLWREIPPRITNIYTKRTDFPYSPSAPWCGGVIPPTSPSPIRAMGFAGSPVMSCAAPASAGAKAVEVNQVFPTSDSLTVFPTSDSLTVGATVEGSVSNQSFVSTEWNGDLAAPLIFQFRLFGSTAQAATRRFCPGCGRQLKSKEIVNFCANCGTDLR